MDHMWCWRCRAVVPMLDEQEFAEASRLFREGMKATKEFRERHNIPLEGVLIEQRFQPLRDYYEAATGMKESNHLAILHHRLSLYGPPCHNCQKPLRTPKAKLCASCMTPVTSG